MENIFGKLPCKTIQEIGPCDKEYREAAGELKNMLLHGSHCFSADLFRLIMRADRTNFIKLSVVYPFEAKVVIDWMDCGTSEDYFKKLEI